MGEGKGSGLAQTCSGCFHFLVLRRYLHCLFDVLAGSAAFSFLCDQPIVFLFYSSSFAFMSRNNKKTPLLTHLVAGGAAGFMEACSCHPLDTIKVRMQLAKHASRGANVSPLDDVPRKQ
jgi:hypothetical protein